MITLINTPISEQTTAETIRDRIAEILKLNLVEQKELADPENKKLFKVPVFVEAARPWEQLREANDSALINVSFNNDTIEASRSSSISTRAYRGTFYIDCIASAKGRSQERGDQRASFSVQRLAGIVTAIMASPLYTYLEMRGVVHNRTIQSRDMLTPSEKTAVENIAACRVTIETLYNEYGAAQEKETIETISVTILSETGEVLTVAEYTN